MQESFKSEPVHPDPERAMGTQHLDSPFDWRISMRAPAWRPQTDIYETEDALIVRMEIAGMKEGDFTIELNGRLLTIRGQRQDVAERRAYHQMEIRFGEFSVDFELPIPVDADGVEAAYSQGFLRISLPKAQPRQIPIAEV